MNAPRQRNRPLPSQGQISAAGEEDFNELRDCSDYASRAGYLKIYSFFA
jgi:hypothetical protein